MARICSFLALLALTLFSFSAHAAPKKADPHPTWPTHLRLQTGPNGGQWFVMGDPIARVLTQKVRPTTSRMGGGMANIGNVNDKSADIGFTLACFLGAARSGEKEYQSIKMDNTSLLVSIYPQVLYFLVRKDFAEKHGITSVENLLQKKIPLRFASLKPGTASEFILNLLFKYGYNTSFDALRKQGWSISFSSYAETADNFVAGDVDCFAYTAGTDVPLIHKMEEFTEVLVLPLEPKVLGVLSEKFKTSTYTIKPGDYKSVTKPIVTLGDFTVLVIRKDLPNDMVTAISKALWDGRKRIAGVISDYGSLSPETAIPAGHDAHPGAKAFWDSLNKK